MITDPVTLPPTALLHEAEALMHRFKFRVCRSPTTRVTSWGF